MSKMSSSFGSCFFLQMKKHSDLTHKKKDINGFFLKQFQKYYDIFQNI